jgi:RNA polymerase sigma factor (sigma-70 family)
MDQHTNADHDQALSGAWEKGDERGYEGLVTRYAPLVYARCRRALGAADADDATQAVFLVLANKRDQAIASPALAAWLLTVAENVIRNARRDLGRRRRAEATAPRAPIITDEVSMLDIQDDLDAALAELPAAERTAVQLHLLSGHTLAEVADHVGAPVSTVHARVQRGLERLRQSLVGRGTTIGMLTLMAMLSGEANAAVPASLLVRLRDSNSTDGVDAASVVSARALRWSKQGLSPMSKYAIAGAAVLLGVAAAIPLLFAADSTTSSTVPQTTTPPTSATAESASTHRRFAVRMNDGIRTAQRLGHLPELALLSKEQRESILNTFSSIKHATFELNGGSLDNLYLYSRLEAIGNDSAVMSLVRTWLAEDSLLGIPLVADDQGWLLKGSLQSMGISMRIVASPHGFQVFPADQKPGIHVPAETLSDFDHQADFSYAVVSERKNEKKTISSLSMTIAEDGLRLVHTGTWSKPLKPEEAKGFAALPRVKHDRLRSLPHDTIAAAVMSLSSSQTKASALFAILDSEFKAGEGNGSFNMQLGYEGIRAGLTSNTEVMRRTFLAIKNAFEQVDGDVVTWLQPGTPLPTWSLAADLPQAAAQNLFTGLGLNPDAQGIVHYNTVTMGWREGRLIITSNPQGLAGVVESGGFTDHEDVQRGLTAMPNPDAMLCAVLRPGALVTQLQSFSPLFLTAEQQEQFTAYQKQVTETNAYGFLSLGLNAEGMKIDAGGVLAIAAAAGFIKLMLDPLIMLNANN